MLSRIINMTVPEALIKDVDEIAKVEGRTRSELFREAVRRYVKNARFAKKDSSGLLSRLAASASKGPNVSTVDLDGVLYPKNRSKH